MKTTAFYRVKSGLLLAVLAGGIQATSFAQANGPTEAVEWGKSAQGVQLSIAMTNSVFMTPSSTMVTAATTNSSANEIRIDISFPTVIFDLLLTNNAGKIYHVTTPLNIRGPRRIVTLKPGERRVDFIPTTFPANIELGDYTLTATRSFTFKDETFRLFSNGLRVQMVKAESPAGTNEGAGLFKMVINEDSGLYAVVNMNRDTVFLKDKSDQVIWSTNIIKGLASTLTIPGFAQEKIRGMKVYEGDLWVGIRRGFGVIDIRTGKSKGFNSN